jgi:stearoyl-CoA desaturase (delta-9 desaturase)
MLTGLIELPIWGYIAVTLVATHITIAAVTIYLHRAMAHRALDLHPVVSHFFRLWLWLTTGMVTRQWIAVHRKHHAKVETEEDPHSPQIHGRRRNVTATERRTIGWSATPTHATPAWASTWPSPST